MTKTYRRLRKRLACVLQGHIWANEAGRGFGWCVRCGADVED